MSGLPWFELDTKMPEDPKVLALGAHLGDYDRALACIVRLYAYCYRHATDRFRSADVLATSAGWRGDVTELFAALSACGFVDVGEEIVVHGVGARLAPHLRKQALDRARQKKSRENAARRLGPVNVTVDVTRDSAATTERRSASVERESRSNNDKDSDKELQDPDPRSPMRPPRSARLGPGHPAFEALAYWRERVWPSIAVGPLLPETEEQAQRAAFLCGKVGTGEVKARMDLAAADPFWRERLDLGLFLDKFDRFVARPPAPAGTRKGMEPVGTDWDAKL